jgi:hypothetical protein
MFMSYMILPRGTLIDFRRRAQFLGAIRGASSPYKARKKGKHGAIDDLVTYLKNRPPEDVKHIHDLAVRIFERSEIICLLLQGKKK